MEQVLKILKQLMGTGGMLGGIPKPIKLSILYLSVVVGVMVIFKYAHLDQSSKTFLIIALVVLAIITGVYYAWQGWKKRQQNQQFGGEIANHTAKTPIGIDASQRARLDDMRKKFQGGVDAYKSRGKNLYSLPWYVMAGEPGSGKTEAIRHSNVGFPPGMQDEFQGVGGTINMNWWFTNKAVMLDTAGRLMFEEVKPGETSEWQQFLSLLKKNRPNEPINGLFLVIPSDSLIKDSADAIQKKAGKIAQQLDVIQRVLDVRFPVFVVITKCDKINGFREFFDGLTDPQLQHQILGWSNPAQLDEPFRAELIVQHLEHVAGRLRRRRLGLLRDPIPENPENRRTDEVDALYAFPHSLELLGSRLTRYLETIFVAGEWSAKPLFLRGIYFTSSMREGSALDAELAEAIGMSVDELPEGKVWERERAFFLRDLFLEKAFPEKGLVTKASNTKQMLRSRQLALFGIGFLGLAALTALAWFAKTNLSRSVKDQGDYWTAVAKAGWENKTWNKSVVPKPSEGSSAYRISTTNTIEVDNKAVPLGEFHAKLRDLVQNPLKENFLLPAVARKYNQHSKKAQQIVLETGVVLPLVQAARQKMATGQPAAGYQPEALVELIQLEADILTRGAGTMNQERAKKFLGTFQNYIEGKDSPVESNLVALMAWTYSTNEAAKGQWPPHWLSGGTNSLGVNTAINAGLDQFVSSATNEVANYESQETQISSLASLVRAIQEKESAFLAAVTIRDETRIDLTESDLYRARKRLDEELMKPSAQIIVTNGSSLARAHQALEMAVTNSAAAALDRVRGVNRKALEAHPECQLQVDIQHRLDAVQAGLSERARKLLGRGNPQEFGALDVNYLAENAFDARSDLYERAEKLVSAKPFSRGKLVGKQGEPLQNFLKDEIGPVHDDSAKYAGSLKKEVANAIEYLLKRAEKNQTEAFFAAYIDEAKESLALSTGFPLVRGTELILNEDSFSTASAQLKSICTDLDSQVFQQYKARERNDDWKKFAANTIQQQAVVKALQVDEVLGACSLSIEDPTDSPKDSWRATWRNMKLVCDHCGSDSIRTGDQDQKLGEARVQQKIDFLLIRNVAEGPNSPSFSIPTQKWGPLWLIHTYKGERDRVDQKKWHVDFRVKVQGADFTIPLKLKFDGVLPELDKWPVL